MLRTLHPETVGAWERYFASVNRRVDRELSDPSRFLIEDFLSSTERAQIRRQLDSGEIVVRRMTMPDVPTDAPSGEIHHWWGAVLVPGIRLSGLLTFLKDYDHHAGKFEEVEQSRLLSRSGEHYKFLLRLKRSKAVVTVSYNTEQEATYSAHGPGRASSRSNATKIAELESPGTAKERELPQGQDSGYLWRLASWWRFKETDRGVIVELESASLSRDIPFYVKIVPGLSAYIRNTPKESLESVLESVRKYAPATARR